MLKCGQKNNLKYTFGLRKEQREEMKKDASVIYCESCGSKCSKKDIYCSACGEKL